MKLLYLALKNYRRFKSVEVEFPDGLIGVIGRNGAGKSSLLEAVAWALFGNEKSIVRTDKESVKREGSAHSDPCRVILEFELDRAVHRVERQMTGKNLTMTASLEIDGKLQARGAREVTEAVEKLFGMDHKSFFISIFAQQKELNALTTLRPAERRKEILRMLDIENIDDAIRLIREDQRQITTGIKSAREELTAQDGTIIIKNIGKELKEMGSEKTKLAKQEIEHNKRLDKTEQELEKAKKETEKVEKTARKMNELQNVKTSVSAKLEVITEEKQRLEKDLDKQNEIEIKLKSQKTKIDKYTKELESVDDKTKKALKERDSIRSDTSELKAGLKQIYKDISEFKSNLKEISSLGAESECPTCKRRLGQTYGKLLENFESQIKEKEDKIKDIDEKMSDKKVKLADCEARIKALEKRNKHIGQKVKDWEVLGSRIENIGSLRKTLKSREKEIKENKSKIIKIAEELDKLQFDEKAFSLDKKKQDYMIMQIRQIERELGDIKAKKGRLEANISNREKELKRLEELESKISERLKDAELLTTLEEVMNGFKQNMISRIRPSLSSSSSQLISALTNGKYSEITLNEDYEISMADGNMFHPIDRFSGGERDMANLCLRLAISQVIAERSGTGGLSFIILDEIFGSQDEHRRKNIFSSLNALSNRFKQMFLITHLEEVKDMMGSVLSVTESEDGTSTVEVLV